MSYKRVIAIGDSFTRGDELADYNNTSDFYHHSKNTWPALIAKSLNADYKCVAIGGRGNQWISWEVAANIYNSYDYGNTNFLFIVNWSWFERFDYVNIDDDSWMTTHPRHDNKLDHYFYRNLDSDLWNLFRNLQQIHSTISLLKQHNINFIMTCIDPLYNTDICNNRSTQWIEGWRKAIRILDISSNITTFDNMTFLEWSHINDFKCGPNGHPLEDAHSAAAQYIQRTVPLLH